MAEEHDTTTLYVSTDGEELSFAHIAMASRKDPDVTVKDHPEGYFVDGVVFRPIADNGDLSQ